MSRLTTTSGLEGTVVAACDGGASFVGLDNTGWNSGIEVCAAGGELVTRIQLLPIGEILCKRDGRRFRVRDLAHAQAIVAATTDTAGRADVPIDYDHQTLFGAIPKVGGTAPASGWMRNFSATPEGIFADVEWTEAAAAKLKAREYRYISPVFRMDPKTGDALVILHAALTNYPAITELAAVASATSSGDSMDLTKLALALGLKADATLDEIVAAQAAQTARLGAIAAAAGLTPNATDAEIAAAKAGLVDPTKYVPISELQAANARLDKLESESATAAASAAVDAAIAAGKVTPANRDWAMGYAKKDLAGFQAFSGNAPVVVTPKTEATTKAPEKVEELTEDQIAACKATGCSPEAFLKTLKEEIAHGRA